MAITLERAPAAPRPWLRASRVLLVATGSMFCHGVTGFGRPARLCRHTGRLVRE